MLFPISELIQDQDLLTIPRRATLREALEIMGDHDYSQLPVVDEGGRLVGLVTEQSIVNAYRMAGGSVALLELAVDHVMVAAVTVSPETDLFDALDLLKNVYAVVVVEDHVPIGILTDYDTTVFFRNYSEGLIFVQDVELTLRGYIESLLPDENPRTAALLRAFGADRRDPSRPAKSYDFLSFGDHIQLIVADENWEKFEPYLGPKALFTRYMSQVGEVRNQLAHFRGQLARSQRAILKQAIDWISNRPKIRPESRPLEIGAGDRSIRISLDAHGTVKKGSKYALLTKWLDQIDPDGRRIEVGFDALEEILGDALPPSARQHRAWWGNHHNNAQAKAWLNAGWLVDGVDFAQEKIQFRQSRSALYVRFFQELLDRLKTDRPAITQTEKATLDNNLAFSAGVAGFLFAWTLPREPVLRVDLDIDPGDKDTNLRAFERLLGEKDEIEREISENLTWDPIPDARACRIYVARPFDFTFSEAEQQEVKAWGVETMRKFVEAFRPRLQQID